MIDLPDRDGARLRAAFRTAAMVVASSLAAIAFLSGLDGSLAAAF
jgi:hypothetical protein